MAWGHFLPVEGCYGQEATEHQKGTIGHKHNIWPIDHKLGSGWNCCNTNGGGSFFVVVTDKELYLDVERPYPSMLRRPPYPESLETRKEIEKHINELLELDVIRNIVHNEIVEITTPFLMTWHDGKPRLCGNFRALNDYTKADRYVYPIQRIPHALDKLAKAKYITKRDCMKGLHQN
ncbi:hypothetical protein O181_084736 [Austropuccinia psidii MF-1]|uniref:Reverse transcriptase domain-containing protein n=1 Tax=Austropuccinia psidii MF-1 TaxID=1389203 RepID=A0A9Q3IJ26_9BASI|nr:hypothetical protein [Austropuccinia psidii MF-1]